MRNTMCAICFAKIVQKGYFAFLCCQKSAHTARLFPEEPKGTLYTSIEMADLSHSEKDT